MYKVDLGGIVATAAQRLCFLIGMLNCDAELVDVTEPLVSFSIIDLRLKVLAHLVESFGLAGLDLEKVASYAGVFMNFPGILPCCR